MSITRMTPREWRKQFITHFKGEILQMRAAFEKEVGAAAGFQINWETPEAAAEGVLDWVRTHRQDYLHILQRLAAIPQGCACGQCAKKHR